MKFKKRSKVWFTQPGKEKLPAIIKEAKDNVYNLHVFYNGYWQDEVASSDMITPRDLDLSSYLFELRKHFLE